MKTYAFAPHHSRRPLEVSAFCIPSIDLSPPRLLLLHRCRCRRLPSLPPPLSPPPLPPYHPIMKENEIEKVSSFHKLQNNRIDKNNLQRPSSASVAIVPLRRRAAAASADVFSATASSAATAIPPPPSPPLYSPPPLAHNLLTKGRINRNVSTTSHEHKI